MQNYLSVFPGESFDVTVSSSNELGHPAEGLYRILEVSDSHSVSEHQLVTTMWLSCDQYLTIMWLSCDCNHMQPQMYCTEWSLQISIAPSTIQHFPNANQTEFHIEVNSKIFVVGSNYTLLFIGQGQTLAGQKVRGRLCRRVHEKVERGRVGWEGRPGRG